MFESLEIRSVANGFVVTVHKEDGTTEYVFDSSRKSLKFIKELIEASPAK